MKCLFFSFVFLTASVAVVWASEISQTDWAAGPGQFSPVTAWGADFQSSSGVSWKSVPGQLALSSNSESNWDKNIVSDTYMWPFGVATGDVDGDGDLDAVGTAEFSGVVCLWLNNGTSPVTWTEQVISNSFPGATGLALADMDDDGDLDILASANGTTKKIVWWRNNGGQPLSWAYQTIQSNWSDSYEVHADDVDGDGHIDVLSTQWTPGNVTWWRNSGSEPRTWVRHDVTTAFAGAHSVHTGDLDGDGDLDLVAAGATCNEIAWWANNGSPNPTWTKTVLRSGFTGARSVRVADIDNDGDLDVVGVSWNSHLAWWRNDGGDPQVWTEQILDDTFVGGHGLTVSDIDGDGRLDIVGASYLRNRVAWWRQGDGEPIVWTPQYYLPGVPRAMEVATGDFDGDGDLDIFASSYTTREFAWYEVTRFSSSGELTSSILDTGTSPVGGLDWTAAGSSECELQVEVRSGPQPESLGVWSEPLAEPGPLAQNQDRYFQYRVQLSTADPNCSPILHDFSLQPAVPTFVPDNSSTFHMGLFPNPSNPATVVEFSTPGEVPVSIAVHDLSGRLVQQLFTGVPSAGVHNVRWEGRDRHGRAMSTGIYLVQLWVGTTRQAKKLTLVR